MNHIAENSLRELIDATNLSPSERNHLAACASCQRLSDEVRSDARAVAAYFAEPLPAFDTRDAWVNMRSRLSARSPQGSRSGRLLRLPGALTTAAIAGLLVLVLGTSGLADSFFAIFEPHTVVPVTVSPTDMRALGAFADYGRLSFTGDSEPRPVANAAAASAETGLSPLLPAVLPRGLASQPTYAVVRTAEAHFVFDGRLAQTSAARRGVTLTAMPADLDGTELVLRGGPALAQLYRVQGSSPDSGPLLVVATAVAPVLKSSGATLTQLQEYLLAQPGITPALADAIRSIGDPSTTLPLPVPSDRSHGRAVSVNGNAGVYLADPSGLGGAVLWAVGGRFFGVGGAYDEAQLLAVAEGLR